ncbi:MAG: gamma-glutamylcyclotransferase [Desulforhopalus sp.]
MAYRKYFAYGSNMSKERLQKRVPSAKVIGVFSLSRYELRFHKIGKDGSAKGDAFFTGKVSDVVVGVLYSIDCSEKLWLDEAEGLGNGYEEKEVTLINEKGQATVGLLYYATNINSALRPFSWYVHHILKGAENAKLPKRYVQQISSVQTIEDADRQRDTLERSLYTK